MATNEFWTEEDEMRLQNRAERADDIYLRLLDTAIQTKYPKFFERYQRGMRKYGFSDKGWKLLDERNKIIEELKQGVIDSDEMQTISEGLVDSGDEAIQKAVEEFAQNLGKQS